MSEGLKKFLHKVIEKDLTKRYTIEQLKKDEWVNEGLQPLSIDLTLNQNLLLTGIRN